MGEVHVSAQDEEVRAGPGDDIVVRLPENATTGYRWHVESLDGGLEVVADDYAPPGEILPGAGGTRVLRLRPAEAGEARLELVLQQPWGDDVADRYALRVTVE
ncbi:protease inhibitor I42 family protein [Streptomyces sp. NPDC046915]|uniref:protease inhibitor I42 family protein n=1 Tax=Streptomyces sp. NPDC046915 TaxID=3155257 RepID=UPI0033F4B32C